MLRSTMKASLVSVGFLLSAMSLLSREPNAGEPNSVPQDKQTIVSTPGKSIPAASVKFRKDLNLPYASLSTLGSRIDAARRAGDPVALAHAANELHVAEKVSGKTASLTAQHLLKESAELASLRKQVAEMQASLTVASQIATAQDQLASMNGSLQEMQSLAKQAKDSITSAQEPTGPRTVVVNNYTTQYIDVQVNGYLRGQVTPGSSKVFAVDQLWNPISLKGWGDEDTTIFGPVYLRGKFGSYTWNINGDSGIPNGP